jgi:hypothetical protein
VELKKLIEKIIKNKAIAEKEVELEPVTTYKGRMGNKTNAVNELEILMMEYRNAVIKSSLFILSIGDESDKFLKLAEADFGCLCFSAEKLFNNVADMLDPQIYMGQKSSGYLVTQIQDCLSDLGQDAGVLSLPMIQYKTKYDTTIKSKQQLVDFIKILVVENIGVELLLIMAVSDASKIAIKEQRLSSVLPIALDVKDMNLLAEIKKEGDRFTKNVFTIGSGKIQKKVDCDIKLKETSQEEVEKALVLIKSKITA